MVIIGNGFDLWQGLHTSYSQFEAYYHEHRDEILKKLRIKKYEVYQAGKKIALDEDGTPVTFSDVELIYGDPFDPVDGLTHEFWYRFEDSLDKLDDQRLNYYFGKDTDDLKDMRRSSRNAQRILRKAFCDWIATLQIDNRDTGYKFGDNCLFVNFNYTDTLIKRFHVNAANEYHIHGEATDPKSIIFGHATHPEYPYPKLYQLGGRFRGLYFIEEIRYNTDKHVIDNFGDLCMFFAIHGVKVEDIKKIYVLGHSFGDADMEYFRCIINATQGIINDPEEGLSEQEIEYLDYMEPIDIDYINIQYAMHGSYRSMGIIPNAYPPIIEGDEESEKQRRLEAAVVRRRFLIEQHMRDIQRDKEFAKIFRRNYGGRRWGINRDYFTRREHESHIKNAPQWHISYYSSEDKLRIENTMHKLKCEKFTLYPSIDECLNEFKV